MSKQSTFTLIETLFSQSKDYVENRLELIKLKAVDKSANVFSALVSGIILFFVFLIFFLILNIGLALWIGDLAGKSYIGFLILALFYMIIGLVIFFGRNTWMKTIFTSMVIKKFL